LIVIISIILVDQASKLAVFHYMSPGYAGEIKVFGNFFKLHYIQNPGMAFGIKWDNPYGKLLLSLFRLGITVLILIYFFRAIKSGSHRLLMIGLSLIIAGAIGNGIDSTFYGVLLNNAPPGSLSPWLHGKVIDMFYVDIWKGNLNDSIPIFGGKYLFLWPIFNVADTAVSTGVILILVFQRRIFQKERELEKMQMAEKEE